MNRQLPEGANPEQLRKQAKELQKSLLEGDPDVLSLAHGESFRREVKLADAQRILARSYGFSSWPKLIAEVETPLLLAQMREAIEYGRIATLDKLLKKHKVLRNQINEPMFAFDSPPLVRAMGHTMWRELVPVLLKYGADPNIRTKWWAGSFSALDQATDPQAVQMLLEAGASWDVWSASKHGEVDVLSKLLAETPELVNAPGGDGQRPLHVAKTVEVAKLLVQNGADLEVRDIDHESTPAMYQIDNLPVLRFLLDCGAKPDAFMAVVLDDEVVLAKAIALDPNALTRTVGLPPFKPEKSDGGDIYNYKIGVGISPLILAAIRGSKKVLPKLLEGASPGDRAYFAAWKEDESEVRRLLSEHNNLPETYSGDATNAISLAAEKNRGRVCELLVFAGFDPEVLSPNGGTSLHNAAWHGNADAVRALAKHVSLSIRDSQFNGRPLDWAVHGSQFCRNPAGDYPGCVQAILEVGKEVGWGLGETEQLLKLAGKNEAIKQLIRSYSE